MPDFPSSSSASGIWQMRQVKRAVQGGNWPPLVIPDPYFEYVSLLLPGNGTNGAQNNTFLDSSTNNFTITRNGNTTQGTFTPYGANWSNYFNNSTGLGLAYGTATHTFWNSNFTLEFWVNCPTKSFAAVISSWFDSNFGGGSWQLAITTGIIGLSNFQSSGTNQGSFITSGSTRVDDGLWHHVAVTQVTGANKTFRLFVDGVLRGYKVENNWTQGSANSTIYIGNQGPGTFDEASRYLIGYLSNLRLTTSVVSDYSTSSTTLGTTVFTPPTAPLSVTAGTNILTCADNRFIDDSTNNFPITRLGDVSTQRFSPFNPTASYAAATIGGSGVFDAVNDTLTTPVNAAFNLGTGAFQIDFWMYPTGSPGQYMGPFGTNNNGGTGGIFFANRSGNLDFVSNNDNITLIRATYPSLNNWHHVVLVRNSSGLRAFFLDGVRVGTASDAADFNQTQFTLGAYNASFGGWPGYLSNFRIIKGSNIADPNSATVAVPTAPTTAVAGTQFLCNFTNGGIIDNAMMNDLETVGNAQISTAQSKFGGGSMAFDGTGDYLIAASRATTSLEGNFTIEGWAYLSSTAAAWPVITIGDSSGASGIELYRATSNGKWRVYSSNTAQIDSATSTSTGSWVHLAVVRSSGVIRLYVNGTNEGSTWSTTNTFSGAVYVAAEFNGGSVTVSANGYLNDLRITKGFARYTSNFSVPTAPFPTQ